MRSENKQESGSEGIPEIAGVVVMDVAYHLLAIDSGALSILSMLSRERVAERGAELPAPDLVPGALDHLMAAFQASPTSRTVCFSLDKTTYTGRIFVLGPPKEGGTAMVVLYLSRDLTAEDSLGLTASSYRLTAREREALLGIVMGLTNKELAQRMEISPSTAKAFVRMVMAKMGVTKRAAVVAKIFERRLKHATGEF